MLFGPEFTTVDQPDDDDDDDLFPIDVDVAIAAATLADFIVAFLDVGGVTTAEEDNNSL